MRVQGSGAGEFRVMSVGWGAKLIRDMLDRIEQRTNFRFAHAIVTPRDARDLGDRGSRGPAVHMWPSPGERSIDVDAGLLASLERAGVPTIHNMITSDRIVRYLDQQDALAWATFLARGLEAAYLRFKPDAVLGGFDSVHGGIGLAVARRMGIPWVAMHFTTLPPGLLCFCHGLTPDTEITTSAPDPVTLRALAETTLVEFERRTLKAQMYLSANSLRMVLQRLPRHLAALTDILAGRASGRYNRFTDYSPGQVARQYVRKRTNLLFQPSHWLRTAPPSSPFVFFGLHMQPESSIDVWAPFYANQIATIETIARALPPDLRLLVKLHRSDADAYSRGELQVMRRLPGVELVAPSANSREFLERASLVVAIQGTMGLEAAMLRKPVLLLGESSLSKLPGVRRVGVHTDLPQLIRDMRVATPPDREAVIRGLMAFLSPYSPGCYNNWELRLSEAVIENFILQFRKLREYIASGRYPAL